MLRKILPNNITALILILMVGAFFRFYNLNWDANFHLHPDERFLTMVGNAMILPPNITEYLDPQISTFNPPNIGYKFFVYGLFPISLNKIIALALNNDNYNAFTIQGRFLSALADTIIIFLIFITAKLLEGKYKLNHRVKYLASAAYSLFFLPVQLAHFFATDTFLNLFLFSSFFFGLSYLIKRNWPNLFLSAIFFGFALSSKISAFYLLPLILFLLISSSGPLKKNPLLFVKNILLFVTIVYLTSKFSYPYMYYSSNIFDFRLSSDFLNNISTLKLLSEKDSMYPPNIQWINKFPVIFPLKNLILFGVGLPGFILFIYGFLSAAKSGAKVIFFVIVCWITIFFLYQGAQTVMTARYFLIIYPFIAIVVGVGAAQIIKKSGKFLAIIVLFSLAFPTLFFFSIYTKPNTRVAASQWMLENITPGATILTEHWDDSLPLTQSEKYQVVQLPVFDPDTKEKWAKMNQFLLSGDYLILSSNRGWGSIPTVPEKYPKMSRLYNNLLEGKTAYKKVKEFTSYPSLAYLGIPITIPDDWSDESLTVYDHPKVLIFKRTGR